MSNFKVGFVILHYMNADDTITCVDSILEMGYSYEGIVIVDNHSNNGSGEKIKKYYQANERIRVIKTRENIGFARANNVGIKVAREYFKAEFVYVLNNDIIFKEEDHIEKLLAQYDEKVAAISPMVRKRNGQYDSGIVFVDKLQFYLLMQFMYIIRSVGFEEFGKNIYEKCILNNSKLMRNVIYVPTGCAIMFTPEFFKDYQGFYSKTFLYSEEHILQLLLYKKGKIWRKVNDTYLIHNEAGSTKGNKLHNKMRLCRQSYWHVFKVRYFSWLK